MSVGVHVLVEVSDCDVSVLDSCATLRDVLVSAAIRHGATVLDELWHAFDPVGATVLVLLAESHASIHTWPETRSAYLDVFTCGDVDARAIAADVVAQLGESATAATSVLTR